METYQVKSAFDVANQIVHVNATGKRGDIGVMLPIKFKFLLEQGTKFQVFTDANKKHLAYRFKNQLVFSEDFLNKADAKKLFKSIAGIRNFSTDRLFFIYAILMAMQSNSLKPGLSISGNMMRLKTENQR